MKSLFVKRIEDIGILTQETEKIKKLREISLRTKLFMVPALINIDKKKGIYQLELITNIQELRKFLILNCNIFHSNKKRAERIFFRIGRALAYIHKNLILPKKENILLNGFDKGDLCFLHGDFGLSNILIQKENIWIIDPSVSSFQDKVFAYGPFYYDLAQISFYSKYVLPLKYQIFYKKSHAETLIKAMISGYENERGTKIDINKLENMEIEIAERYYKTISNKSGLKALLWRRIIKNAKKNYQE